MRTTAMGARGSVNDPRLRWYPSSWRARYGDELTALLDDEYGSSMPVRVRLSLVSGGIRQRARQSGLTGDAVPAADGVRAGALVVLAAWTAFVIAGASFAKFSEHFDEALPHSIGAHRVPDLAFTVLQAVAGVASVLVVGRGCFSLVPAFVRFLRAGGWPLCTWPFPASPRVHRRHGRRDSRPLWCGRTSSRRSSPTVASTGTGCCSCSGRPHRHHLDDVDRGGRCSRAAGRHLRRTCSPRRRVWPPPSPRRWCPWSPPPRSGGGQWPKTHPHS